MRLFWFYFVHCDGYNKKSFGTIWDLYLFSLFWASADFLRTWRKHQDCEPKIREAFTTSWCRPSRLSVTAEAAVATVVQVQKSAGHTHTRVKTTAALMKWTVAFDSQTPQFPSSDNCQITRTTTKHSLASKLGHSSLNFPAKNIWNSHLTPQIAKISWRPQMA